MNSRRDFLKKSGLGLGALSLGPSLGALAAETTGDTPRRFVFIRKSNGIRPKELALPTFSAEEKLATIRSSHSRSISTGTSYRLG